MNGLQHSALPSRRKSECRDLEGGGVWAGPRLSGAYDRDQFSLHPPFTTLRGFVPSPSSLTHKLFSD